MKLPTPQRHSSSRQHVPGRRRSLRPPQFQPRFRFAFFVRQLSVYGFIVSCRLFASGFFASPALTPSPKSSSLLIGAAQWLPTPRQRRFPADRVPTRFRSCQVWKPPSTRHGRGMIPCPREDQDLTLRAEKRLELSVGGDGPLHEWRAPVGCIRGQ